MPLGNSSHINTRVFSEEERIQYLQ